MNELFADTSGWAAWLVKQSSSHARAVHEVAQARLDGRRFVTTNYVLAELVALLTSPLRVPRTVQIPLLTDLRNAGWVEIIQIDSALDTAAWSLWQSRSDKE